MTPPEGEALEQFGAVLSQLERKQNARQVKNRMKKPDWNKATMLLGVVRLDID